ncbi:hypothetical protein SERLADRAFT_441710 [Serpula lacrymans var. lacrymans S7.9]|uniref:Uncharacterized protein n=1 Tax=Serpula lacrymans var. lacrymans (strain S7.9) TaxID=578457 RepID=F8P7E2_SERL9|nr:uncharacterized protein SERLADRAFT_441710 [Serpula lacrymans var. lacrymans S7.9]EGO21358.1 hypothetical protein SERLADRAFT_441710 [Serpula lacrymans var. lacrymans S7.9]
MPSCDYEFALDPPDNIAALSADSVGQDNEGVDAENTYKNTAVPASPLERGPSETNTRVLNSEKHVSFDNSSSSLEPLPTEIPRCVLMHTYLCQKEIHLDVGVENLARGHNQVWAEQIGLPLVKLDISIPVYNVDGVDDENCC